MNKNHAVTKKYLMQIRRLDRAVNHQLLEVARLRALAANISATIDSDRVQVSPTNRLEEMIMKIVDEEEKADSLVDKFIDRKNTIIQQIAELTDEDSKEILQLYFVEGVLFDNIPDKACMSRSKVIRAYNRGLIEFEELHGYTYMD